MDCHPGFIFTLPFLQLHTDLRKLRLVSREYCELVDDYFKSLRKLQFNGKSQGIIFTSPTKLQKFLNKNISLSEITKLEFISTWMKLPPTESSPEMERMEMELTFSDEKTRFYPFLLNIFPQMSLLEEIHFESHSVKNNQLFHIAEGQTHEQRIWSTEMNVPLQLGLANLHEIADSCFRLKKLKTFHVETDSITGESSDCWGPDVTSEVTRKFQRNCPNLRELGVLTSPGPRMLREIRRTGVTRLYPITNAPEIQEAFVNSFLDQIVHGFNSTIKIVTCITSPSTPGASGRSAVLHFRNEFFERIAPGSSLGELADVMNILHSIPPTMELVVIVRASAIRLFGSLNPNTIGECIKIKGFQALINEESSDRCRIIQIPGDELDMFAFENHTDTVTTDQVRKSGSFVVHAPEEPLKRNSFEGHIAYLQEPDGESGEVVLANTLARNWTMLSQQSSSNTLARTGTMLSQQSSSQEDIV